LAAGAAATADAAAEAETFMLAQNSAVQGLEAAKADAAQAGAVGKCGSRINIEMSQL
jgi:hypothetical protein